MSQKGPVPSGRSYHSLACGRRTLLPRHWAERPRFPVPPSLPSSAATARVGIVPRLHPLDTGLQPILPASRMGNLQQKQKHKQLLLEGLGRGGGHLSPDAGVSSLHPSWALGGGLGMGEAHLRGLREPMPRDDPGPSSHSVGATRRDHCHPPQMRSTEARTNEGVDLGVCSWSVMGSSLELSSEDPQALALTTVHKSPGHARE